MYSSEPLMHDDLPDARTAKVFGGIELLELDNIETIVGDFRGDFGVSAEWVSPALASDTLSLTPVPTHATTATPLPIVEALPMICSSPDLTRPPASQHKSTVRATPSPRRATPVASGVRKPTKHTASGVKKSTTSKRNRNRNSTKRAPKTSQKWTYAINGLMRATGDVQRAWGQAVGTAANGRPLPQLLSLDDPSTVEVILDCVGEQCALQGMPEYSREGLRAQLSKPCALFPTRDFRRIKLTLPIAKTCITVNSGLLCLIALATGVSHQDIRSRETTEHFYALLTQA